jgi:hypothetical protein
MSSSRTSTPHGMLAMAASVLLHLLDLAMIPIYLSEFRHMIFFFSSFHFEASFDSLGLYSTSKFIGIPCQAPRICAEDADYVAILGTLSKILPQMAMGVPHFARREISTTSLRSRCYICMSDDAHLVSSSALFCRRHRHHRLH